MCTQKGKKEEGRVKLRDSSAVAHLLSIHRALGSIPNTPSNKTNDEKTGSTDSQAENTGSAEGKEEMGSYFPIYVAPDKFSSPLYRSCVYLLSELL